MTRPWLSLRCPSNNAHSCWEKHNSFARKMYGGTRRSGVLSVHRMTMSFNEWIAYLSVSNYYNLSWPEMFLWQNNLNSKVFILRSHRSDQRLVWSQSTYVDIIFDNFSIFLSLATNPHAMLDFVINHIPAFLWSCEWRIIPAWISNQTPCKVWDGITCPFLNFNGATVEV